MTSLATALVLLASVPLHAEYSDSDRTALIRHLDDSRKVVAVALEGMSADQSNYKPESKVWSQTEVVEHLALMETMLMGMLKQALETTKPVPETQKMPDPSAMDAAILKNVPDRSQKAQAPEQAVPKGSFRNWEDAFQEFSARRRKTIEFVQNTKLDLRRYMIETPMGSMDAHQWILFIAAHTERHQYQIAEMKNNEFFPK